MNIGISKLVVILVVSGVAAIALIVGLAVGIPLIKCNNVEGPTNLIIESPSARYIRLAWVNSEENIDCSVSYLVSYEINNDELVERTTSNTNFGFTSLDLCFTLLVDVWALGRTGRRSKESAMGYYDSHPIDPADIPQPLNGRFSSTDQGLLLEWSQGRELDNCDVYYELRLSIDNTYNSSRTITNQAITIPENDYCFTVDVYITTIIRESVSPEFLHSYTYVLREPDNMSLAISYVDHTVVISWSIHPKQHLCQISHRVRYTLQDSEERIYSVWNNRIDFDVEYCNIATIRVSTVAGERESRGWTYILQQLGPPGSIGPVQHIELDLISDTEVEISWESPSYARSCTDIIYTVTARNEDKNTTNVCVGNLSCTITVEDLCPTTNFTIEATWIPGEEAVITHNCVEEDTELEN